jgi:hypothetical protein
MKDLFRIFRSIPIGRNEVKFVILCFVYLKMVSNLYLGKRNFRMTGEGELLTV